ncbi:hypothetical protein [Streptomyces albiflavescens]|uniref:hypothetical protein n=1 Tax=Streptomyces albiflavescens TaxID=1623582 RepID=UPI00166D74BF|nr:hypothetical protein [Streptomyces albiflavescens]
MQFSRVYHRSLTLFGPAETTADRCFTVDFPSTMSRTTQPRITAHDSGESCTDVAAKVVSRT